MDSNSSLGPDTAAGGHDATFNIDGSGVHGWNY
jgi:hypothetical protein